MSGSAGNPQSTGLVFDVSFKHHDPGIGHPECPQRYDALRDALRAAGLLDSLPRLPLRAASQDDIHLCHTTHYWDVVRHDIARRARQLSTGDTALGESSLEVALNAAGGALSAIDAVMQGKVRNAFAAVRPPGHHATASRGMGFCLFNNVAIAARYAQKAYAVERVLIVDWDVHHGNGTQDIFYSDPSVFFFSIHQAPWYPGTGAASETGEGAGKGTTLNCPLPAGAGHAEVFAAFRKKLLPAATAYKPDLILVSAGFDSRRGDPLGRFLLKDADFAELTALLRELAARSARHRIVSILEGGYNLDGFAKAVVAHIQDLRAQL